MAAALARSVGMPLEHAEALIEHYRKIVADKGLRHADRFVEAFPGGETNPQALADRIRALPDGVTEFLTHPAFARGARRYLGANAAQRAAELVALCDQRVRQAVTEAGIELVSFRQL
jgi:predicted glycoside hydrolase/deacetylase ChbG (UPF0249 family)